jgi:hypothetical protein
MNKQLAVYEFTPSNTIDKLHNIATVLVVILHEILHERLARVSINFRTERWVVYVGQDGMGRR